MHTLYVLSVWLHIVAASVWLGGMIFLALVVVPVIRRPEHRQSAAALIHATGVRFRDVGWSSLAVLAATGVFNLAYRRFDWTSLLDGRAWQSPFGRALVLKLALVVVILALSTVHDFAVGPRATAAARAAPASAAAVR
ncbi:MAG: DUF4149 domain-containing protein, partial [Clostridia bacterium]|nr:DUF4149 domain-containing protein [Clostridia bacterium]